MTCGGLTVLLPVTLLTLMRMFALLSGSLDRRRSLAVEVADQTGVRPGGQITSSLRLNGLQRRLRSERRRSVRRELRPHAVVCR